MTYFATDFQNVDGAGAAQPFVQCLRLQQSLEFYRSYKQKTRDLLALREGDCVLEVGCGTGEDAVALAREVGESGQVFAVDLSTELLGVARETVMPSGLPIRLIQADGRSLPFADSSLDGARIDRTLQHIAEPLQVVAEMSRVVRSGGNVVAMDPDWETLTVDSKHKVLTRILLNVWCDSFPSGGWIGRQLARHFRQAGLMDIEIVPQTLVFSELELADQVLDLSRTAAAAGAAGRASAEEIEEWLEELAELDRRGQFFSSFTAFIVKGTKP